MYIIQMLPFFAIGVAGVADRLGARHPHLPGPGGVFWQQLTRLAVLLVCIMLAFVYVVPRWYSGDQNADTQDLNTGYADAVEWVHTHIPHPGDTRIVVDDTLFLDMLQDGFKPSRYDIYFFKLDIDPDVMKGLGGDEQNKWKSIQYVIETPYMWENAQQSYTTTKLLQNSKVVWYYGAYAPNSLKGQDSDIEIRKVIP